MWACLGQIIWWHNSCNDFSADRVKEIRTDAKVNKVETNKMIAALIAEKKKLLSELENAKKASGYTEEGE